MDRLTGGQAQVKSLIEHGIDTIFGVPGVQLDYLFNALYEERNAIRVIHTRPRIGRGLHGLWLCPFDRQGRRLRGRPPDRES